MLGFQHLSCDFSDSHNCFGFTWCSLHILLFFQDVIELWRPWRELTNCCFLKYHNIVFLIFIHLPNCLSMNYMWHIFLYNVHVPWQSQLFAAINPIITHLSSFIHNFYVIQNVIMFLHDIIMLHIDWRLCYRLLRIFTKED